MATLYPPIEPYDTGMLDVGEGHRIYWELCGNPAGKPAVFLHGGPGSGCAPAHRSLFDPRRYRVLLFDQRNCGRSTPSAARIDTSLETNTTGHLVADIERLREMLGVPRWQVFGGSWGSTLALAYAETHPERVTELIVRGVYTVREEELRWFFESGANFLFPDVWEKFLAPVPPERRGDLIAAYAELLASPDPRVRLEAAQAWNLWEASTITLRPDPRLVEAFTKPDYALVHARIENHYFVNRGFLAPGQLLADAGALADIPGVIVQGRYDACTPAGTAFALHRAWPRAEFHLVEAAGHAFNEPGILDALIAATDAFADR